MSLLTSPSLTVYDALPKVRVFRPVKPVPRTVIVVVPSSLACLTALVPAASMNLETTGLAPYRSLSAKMPLGVTTPTQ